MEPRRTALVCGMAMAVALSCQATRSPVEAAAAPVPTAQPGPAFDVGAVIKRVHFAWRQEGDVWSAGDSTWTANWSRGALTFKPYHYPQGRPGDPATLTDPSPQGSPAEPMVVGEAVRLGAASISRGAHGLHVDASAGNGTRGELRLGRGVVVEELQNSEAGVEQSWRFDTKPGGVGALEVRVPVLAGRFVGKTSSGLHFAAGTLMVRYGHATWVDASGRRTSVPARFEKGAIVLQVPSTLLDASDFPAVLDPVIGPEFAIDTPVYGPLTRVALTYSTVGSDGTNSLVIWADSRPNGTTLGNSVFGTRVSPAGVVLDPAGIPITIRPPGESVYWRPQLAWNGTTYLVVWTSHQDLGRMDVYGTRVSSSGAVLDGVGFIIATNTLGRSAAVASDGNDFMVVWDGYHAGDCIFGSRVSGAGVVLNPAGLVLSTQVTGHEQSRPAIAWGSTNYLVTWQDTASGTFDIGGARLSASGAVLDSPSLAISTAPTYEHDPALAWNGSNFFVIWPSDYATSVSSAQVTSAGAVLPGPILAGESPQVACNGTTCLVVSTSMSSADWDISGQRVSSAGVLLDSTPFVICNAVYRQQVPSVSWQGTNFVVAWMDSRANGLNYTAADIMGSRVSQTGTVLDPTSLEFSTGARTELDPAVSTDGTTFLIVWRELQRTVSTAQVSQLRGARVNGAGTVLDPAGVTVSTGSGGPATVVASSGTSFLVVWATASGLQYARVSAAGAVLGSDLPLTSTPGYAPAVAWTGTSFLVAWVEVVNGNTDIFGARVAEDGTVLDSPPLHFAASAPQRYPGSPTVTRGGANAFVAWLDSSNSISGARVSALGAVLDSPPLPVVTGTQLAQPTVAWDGTNYLVAWQASSSTNGLDIVGKWVSASGVVPDAQLAISTAAGDQSTPALAWDGANYVVTWQDHRGSTDDVYAAQLSPAGVASPGQGVSTGAGDQRSPKLACANQQCLIAWQSPDVTMSVRIRASLVSSPVTLSALSRTFITRRNTPVPITLSGTSADAGVLTTSVLTQPTSGTLTGSAPTLTYTPATGFAGNDSFTFKVSDGVADSQPAAISVIVVGNIAPIATAQSITLPEDSTKTLTLSGTDVDADPLTLAVVTQPSYGTLSGTAPNLTYTPAANFNGADSFTFKANDGVLDSQPATVTITVTPVNDPPTATPQSLTVPQGAPTSITLTGNDLDGDQLSLTVVTQPLHGALSGLTPYLTYTPTPNYRGADSFTFKANDGTLDSAPATVFITLTSVNHAPVATAQSVVLAEDASKAITLAATDLDGDPLTWTLATRPSRGTVFGTAPNLTYVPFSNLNGTDSFTFTVNDGVVSSAVATVSITVTPVNDAPVATPQSVTTPQDTAKAITLAGTDVDGDTLSWAVVTPPAHGTLGGTAPDLIYTPDPNFHGTDSFRFTVSDGVLTSAPTTVSITVTAVNHPPVATPSSVTTLQDTPVTITLAGSDPDGDALTFSVWAPPSHGTLSGTGASLRYTPTLHFSGSDSFSFRANDGTTTSPQATVSIVVLTGITDGGADGGAADGGSDGGARDEGSDGGAADAGSDGGAADGGSGGSGPPVGCGCTDTSGLVSTMSLLGLMGLGLRRRRGGSPLRTSPHV